MTGTTAPPIDKKKLEAHLESLNKAIEDLLLTGLTTASNSTRETLMVSFQEASRFGLLRLGGTLKVACDELGRFTTNHAQFSRKRFSFFLNRAWLLSKGLSRALKSGNDAEFERLKWMPANQPISKLECIVLGVSKKVVQDAFCAFDFRLRIIGTASDELLPHQRLVWSKVFPMKAGAEIPAEGFLHLPQKQGFKWIQLIEGRAATLENVSMSVDAFGTARVSLNEESIVKFSDEVYEDWSSHLSWNQEAAFERIMNHQPSPLELDHELQEEVVLTNWTIGKPIDDPDYDQIWFPVEHNGLSFRAVVSRAADGAALKEKLIALENEKRPPLFGLLHYEKCALVLQPLTLFPTEVPTKGAAKAHAAATTKGATKVPTMDPTITPEHMMISKEKIKQEALLKALKY